MWAKRCRTCPGRERSSSTPEPHCLLQARHQLFFSLSMTLTALVDPRPSDYRGDRLAAAYLDASLMEAAGLRVGDVVRITTHRGRVALARVVGPHPEDLARTIRFDRFTRQSLKAYPHEEVSIERADPSPAAQVVLVPGMDISMLDTSALSAQIRALLSRERTPLREGTPALRQATWCPGGRHLRSAQRISCPLPLDGSPLPQSWGGSRGRGR